MCRYCCILTQTLVCLQILLYPHYPSLSLCCYYFAPFNQLNVTKRLLYYQRAIQVGDSILLTKKTQQIFRLLLLCHICDLQDNKCSMKTERIPNKFVCYKNLHARKIVPKTVGRIYPHIYIYIYIQFSKITFLVFQNTEANILPSELLIKMQKIINEKM